MSESKSDEYALWARNAEDASEQYRVVYAILALNESVKELTQAVKDAAKPPFSLSAKLGLPG